MASPSPAVVGNGAVSAPSAKSVADVAWVLFVIACWVVGAMLFARVGFFAVIPVVFLFKAVKASTGRR